MWRCDLKYVQRHRNWIQFSWPLPLDKLQCTLLWPIEYTEILDAYMELVIETAFATGTKTVPSNRLNITVTITVTITVNVTVTHRMTKFKRMNVDNSIFIILNFNQCLGNLSTASLMGSSIKMHAFIKVVLKAKSISFFSMHMCYVGGGIKLEQTNQPTNKQTVEQTSRFNRKWGTWYSPEK